MSIPTAALVADYPWTKAPLVVCAPLRRLAGPPLALAVSRGGGFGFIGAGDESSLISSHLQEAASLLSQQHPMPAPSSTSSRQILPIGFGLICHSASLNETVAALKDPANPLPAAIWLFAPAEEKARPDSPATLGEWTKAIRDAAADPAVKVWHQVGSVKDALESARSPNPPDVLVVQGMDAGGHGLQRGASLMSLLPEVCSEVRKGAEAPKIVAAGGIADGRGAAAALTLGAAGVVMGTRYLSAHEANVAKGYKDEVVRAGDGGQNTARTRLYDTLRGTDGWPERYGGRGVLNESWNDAQNGMNEDQNKRLYDDALNEKDGLTQWGPQGRLTTYAGTAVGLVKDVKSASEITAGVRTECLEVLQKLAETVLL